MSTYNWNAEDYEKHSQSQQQWARELTGKLSLKGGEDVLDLGCGDGKVTAEIARALRNGTVIGVDNSESMIRLATKRYPTSVYANLSFKVMDASNLTFEGCFDVIFSNAALHWVKNHKPLVEGLYKYLKPGGKILLQMGGRGNARHIVSVLTEIQSLPAWHPNHV
jgi:trans-aconitate 2-methyltransferase